MREIDVMNGASGSALDTEQLVAFHHVVRDGGFSRAAAAMGIGQPAVSSRIAALERAVGGKLLTRGRRLALTPLGESFLQYARRALEILDEGIAVARLAQAGRRGRVSLAALGSLSGGLVGPALATFLEANPRIECAMRAGDHEQVIAALWDGVVEMGLCAWPAREAASADLTLLLQLREPVLLVAHAAHPLARARGRRIDEDALVRLGRPFLRLRWWQSHHPEVLRIAQRAGTAVEVPMETAREMVRAGPAVGFFPRTYIADDLAAGRLVALDVAGLAALTRDAALVRRSGPAPLSAAAAAFVDVLAAEARKHGLLLRGRRRRRDLHRA